MDYISLLFPHLENLGCIQYREFSCLRSILAKKQTICHLRKGNQHDTLAFDKGDSFLKF